MKLAYSGFSSQQGSPVKEAKAAIRFAEGLSLRQPLLVSYTPVGRTNPYQALLYQSFENEDIAVSPIVDSWEFPKLSQLGRPNSLNVFHIHWTSFVLANVTDRGAAVAKIADFERKIDDFTSSGGTLIWTLHNVIPHDTHFLDLEMEIQRYLAEQSTIVHAMSEASVDMMSAIVPLDRSKIVHIPHPNYRGTYEDHVTRTEARLALGIEHDEQVYVLVGALKSYKGLNRILIAFDAFCARDPSVKRRLVVGGMPDDDDEVQSFVRRCEENPRVLIEAKKVPAQFIQYYMRAADVGLAPYTRMLNSGAILLYQTFDLPVITSNVPALWEHMHSDIAESVMDNTVEAMISAFEGSQRFLERDVSWAVRRYTNQFDSKKLSGEFAKEISARLASLRNVVDGNSYRHARP